jgi:uncharacterized membrane protein HdeD (DUF308 family)
MALRVIAILLVVVGVIWVLQGVDILPGSFMTGRIEWAMYGILAVAVGIALLTVSQRS